MLWEPTERKIKEMFILFMIFRSTSGKCYYSLIMPKITQLQKETEENVEENVVEEKIIAADSL